jgi:hypothetical protein
VDDRVDVDSDQLEVVLERDVPAEVAIDADASVEGRGIKGRPVLVFGFWCPCTVFTFLSGFAGANDR